MTIEIRTVLPYSRSAVWDWHRRPGALWRLSPPWSPLQPKQESSSLRDGMALLAIDIAGITVGPDWKAQHETHSYIDGERFADTVISNPYRAITQWRHEHKFTDHGETTTAITDSIATRLPDRSITPIFAYRQQQLLHDLAMHSRLKLTNSRPMVVAVTGSGGNVGTAVCAALTTGGHEVIRLVRRAPRNGERRWSPDSPSPDLLAGVDVLIHLAGESIGGRFTDSHMDAIRRSRVGPTRRLAELVASSGKNPGMVCASAVGYYGADRGDRMLSESDERGDGFLADVVEAWEEDCLPAREAGNRVVNLRTGIVQSGRGGVLGLLRLLFETGLGGRIGDGNQWFSWIALDDLVELYISAALDSQYEGIYNATVPNPVRNREFTKALGSELSRPTLLPVPKIGPRLLLGRTGADELALADQRVIPERLQDRSYRFRYPDIQSCLAHELGGEALLPGSVG